MSRLRASGPFGTCCHQGPQRVQVPNKSVLGFRVIVTIGQVLGKYIGGRQNYGPFLDPYYNAAPNT